MTGLIICPQCKSALRVSVNPKDCRRELGGKSAYLLERSNEGHGPLVWPKHRMAKGGPLICLQSGEELRL